MKKLILVSCFALIAAVPVLGQRTEKPPLHGSHWIAITGKPLGATAGAMMFQKGGNAVDASCAMLAATSTMWDTLGWGGETQALIYDPGAKKVIAINALGVAPTGATADFFRSRDMEYPPEYGPLAATTPGTPGGLMVMLAKYGTLSLADVLAPAIEMADGYPIERQTADRIERTKDQIAQWPYSKEVFLVHLDDQSKGKTDRAKTDGAAPEHDARVEAVRDDDRAAPYPGEIFRQPDLAATLRKLVATERAALAEGKSREEAIHAAYDRFYKGDIAEEIVRSTREQGGLFTMEDLANWNVRIEEPVSTDYRGIEVYKLTTWTQGPSMLQALNILENFDLKEMGYNSTRYIHTLYQALSMAFADRDFYYGDPAFAPDEPIEGLLSKEYAKARAERIDPERNDPNIGPGDPYPYQGGKNPFTRYLEEWQDTAVGPNAALMEQFEASFRAGTTSIQAADEEGWIVSITPSGAWVPAVIAGKSGIGLSQRMQSFVTDPAENPFNVVEPGKRPRVTLTPMLALKGGKPYLSAAVQGGDTQDQNLLQFFLNIVEFGMTPQQASEAANFNSYQLRNSFGDHEIIAGRVVIHSDTPPWVREDLEEMGYRLDVRSHTSGPINGIWFDAAHGTMWGASSNHGEDYGIVW